MARVLRRPMFRMGGNTDQGIMSGVAPRQGYANGGQTFEEEYLEAKAIRDKYAPTRGRGDLSQFLIDFGLDVASATPSGSILSTAAASAKDPYARYTAQKEARLADEAKFTTAMVGDIYDQRQKTKRAEIEAAAGKSGAKDFEYAARHGSFKVLIEKERKLKDELAKLQRDKEGMPETMDTSIIDSRIARVEDDITYNDEEKNLYMDKEEDQTRKALLADIARQGEATWADLAYYDKHGKLPPHLLEEGAAEGGRIGYATAGQVIPGEMPRTSQADVIQSMSFEDLRSRLPATITNDVIQLLANSQEALVEFSNIQTESDIRSFNRKYEVNLVLPPEA